MNCRNPYSPTSETKKLLSTPPCPRKLGKKVRFGPKPVGHGEQSHEKTHLCEEQNITYTLEILRKHNYMKKI